MKRIKIKNWVLVSGIILALFLTIQTGRYFLRDQEWKVRNYIYTEAKKAYPDAVEKLARTYGLKSFRDHAFPSPKGDSGIVILIHGLDEPGMVWMNLAPALYGEGYEVLLMTYPNDQPIKDSSAFFLKTMTSFFPGEKRAVSIVAHSMGGLISRDMLTDPLYGYPKKAEQRTVPRIRNLIMVGTPNHGSELAQFRFFTEIRDQFHQLLNEDSHWMNGFLDGAGEAGIDLLPGSRFLTQLNSRPLPDNLNMHVIAGIISPWSKDEIPSFIKGLEKRLPHKTGSTAKTLEKALLSMGNTLGDGLVSVDSARLDGVPLTTVRGTHLTMIRNLSASSSRIPPAVPLILKLLTH
jgi:pimeloyl-ACP methyl ester carboxylesterase